MRGMYSILGEQHDILIGVSKEFFLDMHNKWREDQARHKQGG